MYYLIAKIELDVQHSDIEESTIKRTCHKLKQNFPVSVRSQILNASKGETEAYITLSALWDDPAKLSQLIERISAFIEKDGNIRVGTISYGIKDIDWFLTREAREF